VDKQSILKKSSSKLHLIRLVVFNKTIVQQNSVETLHNNSNSLKQKKRNLKEVTGRKWLKLQEWTLQEWTMTE